MKELLKSLIKYYEDELKKIEYDLNRPAELKPYSCEETRKTTKILEECFLKGRRMECKYILSKLKEMDNHD